MQHCTEATENNSCQRACQMKKTVTPANKALNPSLKNAMQIVIPTDTVIPGLENRRLGNKSQIESKRERQSAADTDDQLKLHAWAMGRAYSVLIQKCSACLELSSRKSEFKLLQSLLGTFHAFTYGKAHHPSVAL